MKAPIKRDPRRLRQSSYPKGGDQLDALWKIVGVLIGHVPAEALKQLDENEAWGDALAVLDQVKDTKDKFPRSKGGKARW